MTIQCDTGHSVDVSLTEGEVMTILASPAFIRRVQRLVPDRLEEAELGVRAYQQDR